MVKYGIIFYIFCTAPATGYYGMLHGKNRYNALKINVLSCSNVCSQCWHVVRRNWLQLDKRLNSMINGNMYNMVLGNKNGLICHSVLRLNCKL